MGKLFLDNLIVEYNITDKILLQEKNQENPFFVAA